MISRRLALGAFLVSSACLGLHAQDATTQPATTRPASTRPAGQTSDDPNWIGPKSWERHFTIPPFVMTSRGLDMKGASTQPASAGGIPSSYFASRQRRTNTESSSGATNSTPKASRSRGEGGGESRSHRSSSSSHSRKSRSAG